MEYDLKRQYFLGLLFLIVISGIQLKTTTSASNGFEDEIHDAWQQIIEIGAYDFSAEIEQTLIPLPVPGMIGQTDMQLSMDVDGSIALPDQTHLRLKIQGAGLDNSSIEMVQNGTETYLIKDGEQIPVRNPLSLASPTTDQLAYLAAAEDITTCSQSELGTNSGACYSYRINGVLFAAYVRDQLEEQYTKNGNPLPPGLSLSPSSLLQQMSGRGRLLLDKNGLPVQQVLDIDLPKISDEYGAEIHMVTDFSVDSNLAPAPAGTMEPIDPLVDVAPTGLIVFLLLLVMVALFSSRRLTWLYCLFGVGLILILIVSPLLQVTGIVRFQERQAQAASAEPLIQALAGDDATDTVNVQEKEDGTRSVQSTSGPMCGDGDPSADADNDGLSDADELCLGTDPEYADSDRDILTDTLEIDGFDYASRHWTSNPFRPDSNYDGLSDLAEWPAPVGAAPNLAGVNDWDPDGDGVPNIWDDDNDGDQVPDNLDLSPFTRSLYTSTVSLSTQGAGFNGYQYIELQIQPEEISHLRYSMTALDWPHDELGQIQDLDDSTEDVRLFPMLRIQTNAAPNQDLAREYGVSVYGQDDGSFILYAPVSPVGQGGQINAFSTKVAYGPLELADIRWEQVELVWTIQLNQDKESNGKVTTSILPLGVQVEDSIRVTGYKITKTHNYQSAVIGTPDNQDNDRWLFNVLFGLSNTFLTHQDPDLEEIENRFNSPNTDIEQTWGVPSARVVVDLPANPYGHTDEGTADISVRILNYLNEHQYSADETPSLILAIQEEIGLYGLDDQGQFEPKADINLNLANVAMSTMRSLKSNTYRSVDGQWETLNLDETLDVIRQRYEGQLSAILLDLQDDYPDLTEEDLQLLLDMFYTAWFVGQTRIIHVDGRDMVPQERDDDDVYAAFFGDADNLPAYLLEASELGDPGGGLLIGDNQSQTWDYMRTQKNEIGFIDPALKLAGNLATGIVKIIFALRTVNQAMDFAKSVGGYTGMMGIFSNNAGAGARRLGIAGAVFGIALIWATFGLSTDFSDPLAVNQAVAYAVVATVISLSLFILSLNPIGAILVALFSIVDLLVLILCGGKFNLTETIVQAIAEFFYSVDVLTTFQNVEFVDFNTQVMDQNLGLVVGNRIRVTDECIGTIERNSEGDSSDLEDSWVDCFFHNSADGATGVNQNGNRQCTSDGNILTCTDPVGVEFYLDTAQRNVKLTVDSSVEAKTYYQECTFGGAWCWRSAEYTNLPDDLPESDQWEPIEFYLDVLPANFLDLWTWSGLINPDADGDGLDNDQEAELGTNPNNWDTDGDGLSDDFEFNNQENIGGLPLRYDTDADSLSDGVEYRIGTGINSLDTDNDGLTDSQEVYHRNGAAWVGGWQVELPSRSAWVYPDPVVGDADGDGMNDLSEKNLATSPYGYNPAPHLSLQAEPLAKKPGGSEALYVDLNDLVSLTLTLENKNPNAVNGTLTLCLPAFMTDIQGGDLQGDRTPPKGDASSCNGLQWAFSPPYSILNGEQVSTTISARVTGLAASASGEISATLPFQIGDVTADITDQVNVIADLESPTVSLISPPNNTILGGGISRYVMGGSSNDADSWVKQVQVELPGSGWVDAQGAGPWAYTWELPSDGVYTLGARSIDYLDHVSLSASTAVTVDNTAPEITLDLSEGEIVTGESSSVFTITLTGSASDNLSGLRRVQISTDGRPWQEVWAAQGASLNESWSKAWIIPNQETAQGEHMVAARAVDRAGNTSSVLERSFIIDILPPTSELTDRTYLNDLPPSIPTNRSLDLYGVANDEGNAPEPVEAIDLVGELDSLDDATIWLELSSVDDNSSGVSVTWLGDFNGDRLGDMAIGLPGAENGKGRISIIYGRAGDWPVPTEAELLSDSPSSFIGGKNASLGEILAPAGDVNGDGFSDLLVGNPYNNTAYVVFGQAAYFGSDIELGSSRAPNWSQIVAPAGENIGTWLNPAGDVNGDGFDDLLICSTGATGKTYLLLGEPAPWWETIELDVKAAATIETGSTGVFAIGVGDMDGDYLDEFAISTGNTVYLFEGRDTWYSMGGVSLDMDDSIAAFDSVDTTPVIAAVGDAGGDVYGLADFVYANGDTPILVYGDLNRDWDTLSLDFTPAASGLIAAPGDVDADGRADILLGNTEGNAYLILGDDPLIVKATLTGVVQAASTPYAAGADLNADGSSDLLLVSGESAASGRSISYSSLPHVDPDQLPTIQTVQEDEKTTRALRAALSIINVNDDGSCQGGTPCYSNLQTAINNAADGDTIQVEPGVYGSILIDGKDNLTISGVYADAVFIDGNASAYAVKIQNANGVKLENMTLRNANEVVYLDDAGVDGYVITANKIVLDTVLIYDFTSHAVAMDRTSSIQLSQCTLAGNDHFYIYGSADPAVDANWSTVSNDSRTTTGVRGNILADEERIYFLDNSAQIDIYDPTLSAWSSISTPPEGINSGMTGDENGFLWALRGDQFGGVNGPVYAIAYVSANEIYIGGDFTSVGDLALNYIARWDGANWSAVGTGGSAPNSAVYAIELYGNKLYAGGSFGLRYLPNKTLASAWQNWGDITGGGIVKTIAVYNGNVYVGGTFTDIGGITANLIAKREGGSWKLLGADATNACNGAIRGTEVSVMIIKDNYLYFGGQFSNTAAYAGPGLNCGTGCSTNLGRLDLNRDTFSPLTDCDNMLDSRDKIYALDFSGDDLVVGGDFDCVDMEHGNGWSRCYQAASNLAILNPSGYWSLPNYLSTNGAVRSLKVGVNSLLIGGDFTRAGTTNGMNRIARYTNFPNTGGTWETFSGGMNGRVNTLVSGDGAIYAGGDFTQAGGNAAFHLSRWTGSNWTNQSFFKYGSSWEIKTGLPVRLGEGSAIASNDDGILYAIAGGNSTDFYRYTVSSNSWTQRASLPTAVGAGGSLTWAGGYLYALPGGGSSAFYRYDPARNTWQTLNSVINSVSIDSGAAMAWDDHNWLYVLAGGNGRQLQRYRIPDGHWEALDLAPSAVNAGGGLARIGVNLYAVPGGGSVLWSYDPIAQYLEKLTLDRVAIIAPENTPTPSWINISDVVIAPDDFFIGGSESTWVGSSTATWSPEPQLENSLQITHDDARFIDSDRNVYRLDAGSLLDGGYHNYHPEIFFSQNPITWETPSIQQGLYSGANRVRLGTGVFKETIQLPSGVELVGNSADLTILRPPSGSASPAIVRAEGIVGAKVSMLTLNGEDSGINGMAAEDGTQNVTIERTIIRNTDTAIHISGGETELEIVNNTLVYNTNGLVAAACAPVTVRNTIFSEHTGAGLAYDGCAASKLHKYNLFWNNTTDIDPADPGPGELFLDPLFVNPGSPTHDYHTTDNSPVIDAGDPGDISPLGTGQRVDIGYVEQNRASLYVDDDYCPTCLNDGLSWQVDAFDSIQDALDTAADNVRALKASEYTISVNPGTYTETLSMPSYVKLVGGDTENVILISAGAGNTITFNGVVQSEIKGFTIRATPNTSAIAATGASNKISIRRNIIDTYNSTSQASVLFDGRSTGLVEFNTIIDHDSLGGDSGITSSGVGTWIVVQNNILSGDLESHNPSGCDSFYFGHSNGLRTVSFGQIFNDYNLIVALNPYMDDAHTGLSQGPNDLQYISPCFEFRTYRIKPESKARDAASPFTEVTSGGGERADMGYYELTASPLPVFFGREDLSSAMGSSGLDQVEIGLAQVSDPDSPVTDTLPDTWASVTLDSPAETVSYWHTTITPTQESVYRFYSRSSDLVGNRESQDVWYEGAFVADSIAPVVTMTLPANGALLNSPLELRALVYDYAAGEFSVDDIYFVVDGAEYPAEWAADPWDESSQEPRPFRAWVDLSNQYYSSVYAVASDRAGNSGQSGSIHFTVTNQSVADTTAPILAVASPLNGSWYTHTVDFSGTVQDNLGGSGVAAVEVSVDGGYTWMAATINGFSWELSWKAPDDAEFISFPAKIRARDQAGNSTTDARSFSIDNLAPGGPDVEEFSAYLGPLEKDAPPGTHFDFPVFFKVTWKKPIDGSGYAESLIAIDQMTDTLPSISIGPLVTYTQFLQTPGDYYVHLAVQDLVGNQFIRHYGPWHLGNVYDFTTAFKDRVQSIVIDGKIDAPSIQEKALLEWQIFGHEWGFFEFMDDFELEPEGWDWWDPQNLYVAWDGAAVYLGYQGAYWDLDGELWAYIGIHPGGSTQLATSSSGRAPDETTLSELPFEADYAMQIVSSDEIIWWAWNGTAWEMSPFPGEFAQGEGGDTEIRLPFDMETISELGLIVFVLDDEGNPFSVFPTTNPLTGDWSDLYLWDDLGNTITKTFESLTGQTVAGSLSSPQSPHGVWGAGDEIDYVVNMTNREEITLTHLSLTFFASPGIEYESGEGAALSGPWNFAVPDLAPGSHQVVTVTTRLADDLCDLPIGDHVGVYVILSSLPPLLLSLNHNIDCEAPTITMTAPSELDCTGAAVYGSASDGDGAGVALVEYRTAGSSAWLPASGTLFWEADMPQTVTDTWQVEVQALDKYGHTSETVSAQLDVDQCTDLALAKYLNTTTAVPGDAISFTLVFTNQGSCVGHSVAITDNLPSGLSITNIDSSGVVITQTQSSPDLIWEVQDLTPGQGGTITVTANLQTCLPTGVLTNTASIGGLSTDQGLDNNTSSAGLAVQNGQPTVQGENYQLLVNGVLNVPAAGVLDNDSDPNCDVLAASIGTGPSFGVLSLLSTGAFVYTPTVGYTGPDSFTYWVCDSASPPECVLGYAQLDVEAPEVHPAVGGVSVSLAGRSRAWDAIISQRWIVLVLVLFLTIALEPLKRKKPPLK